MIANKYKYGLIDLSYIMQRNLFAVSKGKGVGEYTAGEVIRITIQTINKVVRDYDVTCDKFMLVYDKWDKELGGYYRTWLISPFMKDNGFEGYKGNRVYVTDEVVENMIASGEYTEEQIQKAKNEAYMNKVKYEAKWGMIKDMKNIGIPCFGLDGFEYDDLAWLSSCLLSDPEVNPERKKSVFITKDSDLLYSLSPMMDYFKIPTGGSEPKIITYEEMYKTIPQELVAEGVTLYQYKSFLDSLGEGHNNMGVSKKKNVNVDQAILKILKGDMSDVEDVDLFKAQMESFDLRKFPRIQEAIKIVKEKYGTEGKIGTLDDFHDFCKKYGVTGISDTYFTNFTSRFDSKLFSGND